MKHKKLCYCVNRCLEKDSCDFQVQPRRPQLVPSACKLEVPPKLVFSMLNNKDLQAKLRVYRLPIDGKRQVQCWIHGALILVQYVRWGHAECMLGERRWFTLLAYGGPS